MFKNCRKEDLRIVALELGETVAEKVTIVELTEIIKENKYFKEDVEFVKELIQYTIEDRKRAEEDRKRMQIEEDRKKEAENRLREKELELELARLNVNSDNERTGEACNTLDALVKSVRILMVKVPNRPEGWAFFFASLERAFVSKNVPEKFKSEILLNLLGEKASNVLTYVKDDELNNYEQLKSIILREYVPSANQFLEQFKKATRHPNETYIQYTSRLITNWQYYLKSRKVSDFDNLNDLIVSDKIFSSLEKEVASHISVRAGNGWFRPLELAKEIDLYNTSQGKSLKTLPNVLTRNNPVENASREYEDLGHMREIKADGSGVSFYMPHHGVYRPEKSTTKLRTVFNASSPSTSRKSLNSIQFNGGLFQEDLFSIMVLFRKHKILWKKGMGEPIKTYELTTVTYGTVSAPYLATRTLKQLAMDEANTFPLATPVVLSDCYMDDILSGSKSIEEVIELQHQLIEMFKTAGMHLHKWCGKLPEITSNLQEYAFLSLMRLKR
ncbi:uncharacterized protein TNCV_2313661 [Trichonephila clavipes]|nr:uncharacterized protein TNCV_2313661 [Trichonephila clavipes]